MTRRVRAVFNPRPHPNQTSPYLTSPYPGPDLTVPPTLPCHTVGEDHLASRDTLVAPVILSRFAGFCRTCNVTPTGVWLPAASDEEEDLAAASTCRRSRNRLLNRCRAQ